MWSRYTRGRAAPASPVPAVYAAPSLACLALSLPAAPCSVIRFGLSLRVGTQSGAERAPPPPHPIPGRPSPPGTPRGHRRGRWAEPSRAEPCRAAARRPSRVKPWSGLAGVCIPPPAGASIDHHQAAPPLVTSVLAAPPCGGSVHSVRALPNCCGRVVNYNKVDCEW
jgi:hypothetical protein